MNIEKQIEHARIKVAKARQKMLSADLEFKDAQSKLRMLQEIKNTTKGC